MKNNFVMARNYLVMIGSYMKRDIPFTEKVEQYKILYHKYLHHKQMIKHQESLENLTNLEALLWSK